MRLRHPAGKVNIQVFAAPGFNIEDELKNSEFYGVLSAVSSQVPGLGRLQGSNPTGKHNSSTVWKRALPVPLPTRRARWVE